MNDDIAALLKSVQGTPLYQQLFDYLTARGTMPEIKVGYLPDGTNGEFSRNTAFGDDLPKNGRVTLSKEGLFQSLKNKSDDSARTLTHEMTHAADSQITNHYYELNRKTKKTPEEQRFVDAYNKLVVGLIPDEKGKYRFGSREVELAKKIAPEWVSKNKDYRAAGNELSAFGVGNSSYPSKSGMDAPPHIDTSLAQERSILLDAAMRAQQQTKPKGR